jgi:hypothetical protein
VIGVDAAAVLDATMEEHGIERMTVIRKWNDACGAYVWTVRVATPFTGLVAAQFGTIGAEGGPRLELPDAMIDAVRALSEARREAAGK